MVDASHEKETQANLTIQKLKTEIANLTKLVEQGTGLSIGQEHSVKELLKMKEDLTKEKDSQVHVNNNLKTEIANLTDQIHTLEGQKLDLDAEITHLKDQLNGNL